MRRGDLCERLRISHNAVRQHLTALLGRGYVERVQSQPTGGRPQARFALTAEGARPVPAQLRGDRRCTDRAAATRLGEAEVAAMLQSLGATVAATQPALQPATGPTAWRARWRNGSTAWATRRSRAARRGWQVEAFNCVFHALAKQHPQVCKFDLAYLEAVSGRRIHHMECIVRGGHVCRFRVGAEGGHRSTPTPES